VFINVDTYSNRNYPRTCKPNNKQYAQLFNKHWSKWGVYDRIANTGFAFLGDLDKKIMPKGDYFIWFTNETPGTPVSASINFYSDKGIYMLNRKDYI